MPNRDYSFKFGWATTTSPAAQSSFKNPLGAQISLFVPDTVNIIGGQFRTLLAPLAGTPAHSWLRTAANNPIALVQ